SFAESGWQTTAGTDQRNPSREPQPRLHHADSYVAANVLHARDQHISHVKQPCRPQHVSDGLQGFHFAPFRKGKIARIRVSMPPASRKLSAPCPARSQYFPGCEV